MSTVAIVVVAVWNTLLLFALVVGVVRWRPVLQWIRALDHEVPSRWELGNNDVWAAFLADHPELSRDEQEASAGVEVTLGYTPRALGLGKTPAYRGLWCVQRAGQLPPLIRKVGLPYERGNDHG